LGDEVRHLLSSWPEIIERLKSARTFLLFADYDGTLTPIVDRPEDAVISKNMKEVLRCLSVLPNFTVGVISGRSLTDIINRVGLISVVYTGNHGMEIKELSGVTTVAPEAKMAQPIIDGLYKELVKKLSQIKGVKVENKGLTLSIHYRLVDESIVQNVSGIFEDIVGSVQKAGDIRITHGKKVFEVRPAIDINKGDAIRMLINKYKKGNLIDSKTLLPIYVGDDQTDEDGFNAVEEHGNGISILVGDPQTDSAARYYLESPDEVTKFIRMLYDQVESAFVR
jgi:trehalose 6-phosphate phosphatase